MKKIRIVNLRSLVDTTAIEIKPITVLLGKNSAGKSTFLRSFPLLRQSSEQKTVNDILWFGDYVDFGSFAESLNRNAAGRSGKSEIAFQFELDQPVNTYRTASGAPRLQRTLNGESLFQTYFVTLKQITEAENPNAQLYSEYTFATDNDKATLTVDQNLSVKNFSINGENVLPYVPDTLLMRQKSLLPAISVDGAESDIFENRLVDYLRRHLSNFANNEDIEAIAGLLQYGPPQFIVRQLKTVRRDSTLGRMLEKLALEPTFIASVAHMLFAAHFESIYDSINASLTSTFANVRYITPLRASAERYYRLQGLAVDEISPNGENIAMYLKSLSESEANSFAEWTTDNMGFAVRVESQTGHVSVVIENKADNTRVNLADVGFGYSQVIPILAQIWQIQRNRDRFRYPSIAKRRGIYEAPIFFLIEQPELHLHPKMQGMLAELFFRTSLAVRKLGIDLRIIIETHSETIIGKLGFLISTTKSDSRAFKIRNINGIDEFLPEDVGIYIFDQSDKERSRTTIVKSGFDEKGLLKNWPYDFFDGV